MDALHAEIEVAQDQLRIPHRRAGNRRHAARLGGENHRIDALVVDKAVLAVNDAEIHPRQRRQFHHHRRRQREERPDHRLAPEQFRLYRILAHLLFPSPQSRKSVDSIHRRHHTGGDEQ